MPIYNYLSDIMINFISIHPYYPNLITNYHQFVKFAIVFLLHGLLILSYRYTCDLY